jgi:hypothetical protein
MQKAAPKSLDEVDPELWVSLAAQIGDPLAGFDFAQLAPYFPALAEGYGHEGCQFTEVAGKARQELPYRAPQGAHLCHQQAHPRFKARQG